MKMKKTAIGLLLATMTILVCSCDDLLSSISSHPKNYQDEIEDFVRFKISETNYVMNNLLDLLLSDQLDGFEDEIFKTVHKDHSTNSCEKALSSMANNPNCRFSNMANNILKEYKKTRVVLSDYKKISTSSQTKMWEFKEITTGILFYFSINENEYGIEVDDDSLQRYLEKYFDL